MRQILIFAACRADRRRLFRALCRPGRGASVPRRSRRPEPAYEPRQPATSGRSLTLDSDRQGHFKTEARVDGRFIDFLVDTGASVVVLRESDAARVGIHPMPRDYTALVSTANGKIKAAPAKLDRIEVGGITVFDVPALVMPDESLGQNLLGTSFLSRLKRYEYANGRLVLEQ